MHSDNAYHKQVSLLMRIIPLIANETCFALKGGTAINLFIRDMPRLSVDIDLTYLPTVERQLALTEIELALIRIAKAIRKQIKDATVNEVSLMDIKSTTKLFTKTEDALVKIEVNPVLRGSVYEPKIQQVSNLVEKSFGFAQAKLLSFEDLYGGKLVAALDRQHLRDLYDAKILLENEGLTRKLMSAFLVYLISHGRPMSELLAPRPREFSKEFQRGFVGMTAEPIEFHELVLVRNRLIELIHASLTSDDKEFLLSIKRGEPLWGLLPLPNIAELPAVQWKLRNLQRLPKDKREELLKRLCNTLQPK